MTEPVRIFHNPRCSKSRQTLALLEEQGVQPEIIRYLDTPPDADTLREVLRMLDVTPRELMRRKEDLYRALNLDDNQLTDDQLIQAMIDNPKLIERPIVTAQGRAAIGRPPESVLAILPQTS